MYIYIYIHSGLPGDRYFFRKTMFIVFVLTAKGPFSFLKVDAVRIFHTYIFMYVYIFEYMLQYFMMMIYICIPISI